MRKQLYSLPNLHLMLPKTTEKPREEEVDKAKPGHTWQEDEQGMGGWWNRNHGGYPTPESEAIESFRYDYSKAQSIKARLKLAGINFRMEKDSKGNMAVLVAKTVAQKARNILN